jgi:hypothetical protein
MIDVAGPIKFLNSDIIEYTISIGSDLNCQQECKPNTIGIKFAVKPGLNGGGVGEIISLTDNIKIKNIKATYEEVIGAIPNNTLKFVAILDNVKTSNGVRYNNGDTYKLWISYDNADPNLSVTAEFTRN